MTQIRLGDLLIRAAVVTDAQLNAALAEQKQWGGRLGTILVRMGALSEDLLVKALSRQLSIPRAAIGPADPIVVPDAILARVDRATCEKNLIVPVGYVHERRAVQVALADPFNVVAVDDFGKRVGLRVETLLAGETTILQAIGRVYGGGGGLSRVEAGMAFMDNAGRAMGSGSGPVASASMPPSSTTTGSIAPVPAPAWSTPGGVVSAPTSSPWAMPPTNASVPPSPWSSAPPSLPPQAPPPGFSVAWAPPPSSSPSGPSAPSAFSGAVPRAPQAGDDLRVLADQQLKAMRALVELLVDKGVISRAELSAWLQR